jgi:radical SAM superfamily enzyme YgiQ (UPF0313 family)
MKIVCLNPPFKSEHGRFSREQRSPAITKGGTFYYPMWLCYAAGVLEADGHEVKIIDAPASQMTMEAVEKLLAAFSPRLLVVDTSTPSIASDCQAAERLKALTGAFTVLVGTHPTALSEATLASAPAVDAIARKEYEYTLRELARRLDSPDADLGLVAGLSWRDGQRIAHNPDRPPIENLDELPFLSKVYRDHLNIRDYFYTIAQYPQVAIYSGRGCPHQCCYCVYPQVMHGHKFRKRSVQNVIDEFRFIQQQMPEVREVFIEDDTFTVDKQRVLAFGEAYRAAGLKVSWIGNSRADVDLQTLKAIKACNCRLLCVGFESGDQTVLDNMRKRLSVERARQFVRDARSAGILIHGCFIVGNPGETKQTLATTLAYARSLELDTAQFFPLMVYPGTAAYAWARDSGFLLTEDYSQWNTPDGLHNCVVSRPGLTNEELVRFCDEARRKFYLRPGYILYRLRRLATHPREDGPRMLKSLKQFKKFLLGGGKPAPCACRQRADD